MIETSSSKTNLLVPVPMLLTTVDSTGEPNICTISYYSCIHFEPPTVAISLHPNHKTSSNLTETRKFVINVPAKSKEMVDLIMQVSGLSGADTAKFDRFNIKTEIEPNWPPYLKNSILSLFGMVKEKIEYSNDRILFLGQIDKVLIAESLNVGDQGREYIWKLFEAAALTHSDIYISEDS
ncbi:MAG: flavin reductase family protein [Candidatus Hodarchaeales archaeon]|jgi:flavin reductase (DIM6/NTAB) family NADH-FMN oxidoreductase RutF